MLKVTGSSDDLIELSGDIEEEFNYPQWDDLIELGGDKYREGYLGFSDGTLLEACYDDDGIWRFKVCKKGDLYSHKVEGIVSEDTFDEVYFNEGITWVLFGYQRTQRMILVKGVG